MQDGNASAGSWPSKRKNPEDDGKIADLFADHPDGPKVMLVDDDDLFRESLGLNLADRDLDVTEFADGRSAIRYLEAGGTADVVLLDWRMPGMDGLQVLRRMRSLSIDIPTIFLTVLDNEMYEEAALEGGAVDFVEKSRGLSILLRRIALIMEGQKAAPSSEPPANDVSYGDLHMLRDSSRVRWKDIPVELTLTEFRIVEMIADRQGRDVSYREIYDLAHGKGFVAGAGEDGYRVNVRTFIKRIRRKFKEIDPEFDQIENYPGYGYRWHMG